MIKYIYFVYISTMYSSCLFHDARTFCAVKHTEHFPMSEVHNYGLLPMCNINLVIYRAISKSFLHYFFFFTVFGNFPLRNNELFRRTVFPLYSQHFSTLNNKSTIHNIDHDNLNFDILCYNLGQNKKRN